MSPNHCFLFGQSLIVAVCPGASWRGDRHPFPSRGVTFFKPFFETYFYSNLCFCHGLFSSVALIWARCGQCFGCFGAPRPAPHGVGSVLGTLGHNGKFAGGPLGGGLLTATIISETPVTFVAVNPKPNAGGGSKRSWPCINYRQK